MVNLTTRGQRRLPAKSRARAGAGRQGLGRDEGAGARETTPGSLRLASALQGVSKTAQSLQAIICNFKSSTHLESEDTFEPILVGAQPRAPEVRARSAGDENA